MKENWEITWKDYYGILQVKPSSETVNIKRAFERLARKYHPDLNKEPAALEQMKVLNGAFEILNSPAKRAAYDREYYLKENACPHYTNDYHRSNRQPKTNSSANSVRGVSSSCRKWVPCPRCAGGNMYPEYNGEYVCLQCGYYCSPDVIAKSLESIKTILQERTNHGCYSIRIILGAFAGMMLG
jgi:hypothetical protein